MSVFCVITGKMINCVDYPQAMDSTQLRQLRSY